MNKVSKNKGFSLIEILAAVVILGLLSSLAIVSVNYILKKAEKEYYKAQEDEIIAAAKSYTQDNRNALPKRVGMATYVKLSTLQAKKYIGDVVDRHKNKCDANETVVKVFKYDKKNYSYSIALDCPSYKKTVSVANNDQAGNITIEATTPKEEKKVGNKTIQVYSYTKSEFNITLKDPDKIASYNYTIYLNDAETKNSGEIEGKLKTEINFDVPLKNYLPGKVKIEVTMVDKFGNKTKKDKEITISNTEAPECKALSGQNKEYEWTNKVPVEISVKCISKSDKGCQKDVFTQGYFKSTKTDNIKITDKENNSNNCPVNVYLDIDPPTTPIIKNDYDNKWTNLIDEKTGKAFDYTITMTASDETSGIAYFRYRYPDSNLIASDGKPESEWHIWEDSRQDVKNAKAGEIITYTSTKFTRERGEVLEVQACDHANAKEVAQGNKDAVGNCSESAYTTIKIDKTSPEISNVSNPYLNVWFNKAAYDKNNNAYVIRITSKDKTDDISKNETGISGIAYHSYRYASTSWTEYASSGKKDKYGPVNRETYVFNTTPFTKDRDEKVYFQACDNAGNCTQSESYIMLDRTLPSVTITNPFGSRWYKKSDVGTQYIVTSTAQDATAGLANHDYKYSDSNSWTTKSLQGSKSDTISQSQSIKNTNRSLSFKACDRAGNCNDNSTNIKIDTTPPTCNISVSGTKGNNSWYTTKPNLTLSHTDDYSGESCYGLGTSSNVSCNSTSSGTQSDTTGTKWYGIVKDNAGNISTCNTDTLYVDTTPPTINLKFVPSSDTSKPVYSQSFTGETSASISQWKNQTLKDYITYSDATSGISGGLKAAYNAPGATTSNTIISSSNISYNRASGSYSGVIVQGYRYMEYSVSDKAGNQTLVKFKVNIDTEDPTCDISVSGTVGDNSWYVSYPTITLEKEDDGPSGVSSYGLSTSGYTTNSTSSKQLYNTKDTGTWYGMVEDKAGNYGTCTHSSIRVDTSAPSCWITVDKNPDTSGTYKSKIKLTLNYNNDTISGIASYGLSTGSYSLNGNTTGTQSDTTGTTWYGKIKDNAGNVSTCYKTVVVDTKPASDGNSEGCHYYDYYIRNTGYSWGNCQCGQSHTTAHFILCKHSDGKYYGVVQYYREKLQYTGTPLPTSTLGCPDQAGRTAGSTIGNGKFTVLSQTLSNTVSYPTTYYSNVVGASKW